MLLQNYWDITRIQQRSKYFVSTSVSSTEPSGSPNSIKAIDGSKFGYLWNARTNGLVGNNSQSRSYAQMLFSPFERLVDTYYSIDTVKFRVGIGDEPVAINDYCLDTDVTSSFSNTIYNSCIGLNENHHKVVTVTWTGTNNTNSDITITEVGVGSKFLGINNPQVESSSSGNFFNKEVLIFRHLLEQPVVVPAKCTRTIIIQIEEV